MGYACVFLCSINDERKDNFEKGGNMRILVDDDRI